MRIVQLANFYGPQSGGLRTALDAIGRRYGDAGIDRVLVVPGESDTDRTDGSGRRITLRGRRVPGGGGYHVITDRRRVEDLLAELGPDRVEVSDKLTLAWVGGWARRRGIPSMLLSHERLDAILAGRVPRFVPLRAAVDRWNRRLASTFDVVVCTSAFAREELDRVGARNVRLVPLGVDLEVFHPGASRPSTDGPLHVVTVGRLSSEKRPELAIATLVALLGSGVDARLTMAGGGPLRRRLEAVAAGLPVTFTGHVPDRRVLAALVAGADVALNPCPVEAFGLAVLEAMACGTPVVVPDRGAAPELVTPRSGTTAAPVPEALAHAVRRSAALPRSGPRERAEQHSWDATVGALLVAHGAVPVAS